MDQATTTTQQPGHELGRACRCWHRSASTGLSYGAVRATGLAGFPTIGRTAFTTMGSMNPVVNKRPTWHLVPRTT